MSSENHLTDEYVMLEPHLSDDCWEHWFSSLLWKIDWSLFFPKRFNDFIVRPCKFLEVSSFMDEHFAEIFNEDLIKTPFLSYEKDVSKTEFYEHASDLFLIQTIDGKIIGAFTGNPSDWSTYYLRSVIILEAYQDKKVFQSFLLYLLDVLAKHQVRRVYGEIAPGNFRQVHLLNKLGFLITGFHTSERWGALVKFTKFLSNKHQQTYVNQFSVGVKKQVPRIFCGNA